MKKNICFLFLLMFTFSFSYLCMSQEMGRIIGKTVIYGRIAGLDFTNKTITVKDDAGSESSFQIEEGIILQGYNSLRDIKIGDYVELEIDVSLEGRQKLLSVSYLPTKPDFTDHPDIKEQRGSKETGKSGRR